MKKIVDVFPFFAQTGKRLLELRIELLNPYVDKFVIIESDTTHSGIPVDMELDSLITELQLPREKIIPIYLQIPSDKDLTIEDIDYKNCYDGNSSNINSLCARARERIQKDAILNILDQFDDETVFICSDSDEIINPKYIEYFTDYAVNNKTILLRVPLVHLEGFANLRVYNKHTNTPKEWNRGMFLATKEHFKNATPTQIRSNVNNPYPVLWKLVNDKWVDDAGWHFSWMGTSIHRKIKQESFCHYDDKFDNLIGGSYKNPVIDLIITQTPSENMPAPCGEKGMILKEYPISQLPEIIYTKEKYKDFFFNTDTSSTLYELYKQAVKFDSDINKHLPILKKYAEMCNHVTEFGVRSGNSTLAFLTSSVILRSYDLVLNNTVQSWFYLKESHGGNVKYLQGNTLNINIDNTDLLFIDTFHTGKQLTKELDRHHAKVNKYIIMHDTHTFGTIGENGEIGLLPSILQFLIQYKTQWRIMFHTIENNGLTILQRIDHGI